MKGWSGLLYLVLASVLTVSGIVFGGIEYYRAHPFEPDEVQNFMNMLTIGFLPFGFFLFFRWSRVKIAEKEVELEYKRRFPNDFSSSSPIGGEQKSSQTPLSPPSPQTVNTGGVLGESQGGSQIGEIQTVTDEMIESAIINYVRLNSGLKFSDQSSIARIEKSLLFPVQKGRVDNILGRMHQAGKLILSDDKLHLAGAEPQPKSVKIEPVSSVQRVDAGGNRGQTAILQARIVALISQMYPDPEDRLEQLDIITEMYTPGQYPKAIAELSKLLQEQKAEQAKEAAEQNRLKILKQLKENQNQSPTVGTKAGQFGTVKKLERTGLRQDWDNLENSEEQQEELPIEEEIQMEAKA